MREEEEKMMQSPEAYRQEHLNDDYYELIGLRQMITDQIRAFETDSIPKYMYSTDPGPEVQYKMNHEYLKVLCDLILYRYAQWEEENEGN